MADLTNITEQLRAAQFAAGCNMVTQVTMAVATSFIEQQVSPVAVVQALAECEHRVGASLLKTYIGDGDSDTAKILLRKLREMHSAIQRDWLSKFDEEQAVPEATETTTEAPVVVAEPDVAQPRVDPRRRKADMTGADAFEMAPHVVVPGIDHPVKVLTKGYLTTAAGHDADDTAHIVGCGGSELLGHFDTSSGLFILRCADCGNYIGGIRVANES